VITSTTESTREDFQRAAAAGPIGALVLCALSVAIVVGLWLAFYFLAFLPRGLLQ
jgi:hypothetical protein